LTLPPKNNAAGAAPVLLNVPVFNFKKEYKNYGMLCLVLTHVGRLIKKIKMPRGVSSPMAEYITDYPLRPSLVPFL